MALGGVSLPAAPPQHQPFLPPAPPHRGQLPGRPLHLEEVDVVAALAVVLKALLELWGVVGHGMTPINPWDLTEPPQTPPPLCQPSPSKHVE